MMALSSSLSLANRIAFIITTAIIQHFCLAQETVSNLQTIAGLHSIVSKQGVYDVRVSDQLTATCEVCEAPGTSVSVYWGRDDASTNVPAFVIGGKIKYPRWTSIAAQPMNATCGPNQNGVRYVVKLAAESLAVADSGRWWCQLLPNNKSSDWRFAYFLLNVYGSLSAGSDITLKANDSALNGSPSLNVIENSTTKMACEVDRSRLNSNQNATVTWQIEGASTPLAVDMATFDYVANVEHFGKQLLCIVDYDAAPPIGKAPSVIRRVGLNIILKPRVSISAWGLAGLSVSSIGDAEEVIGTSALVGPTRSVLVDEGQSIELHCSAFNSLLHNSRALTGKEIYRWFVMDPGKDTPVELVYAAGKRAITLGPLERNRDGAIVRCEVDNSHFNTKAQLQFSVQFKLASNSEPNFIGASVGDVVSLDCTADDIEANRFISSYQFTWFFGRLQIILPASSEQPPPPKNILSFRLANNSQFGNYRCLARNIRSGSQAARNFFVIERAKPQASSSIQIVDAVPRYTASIRCSTFGLPRPSLFRWFRDNSSEPSNAIDEKNNGEKFDFFQRNLTSAITEATLVIRQVQEDDFGRYVCIAVNDYGQVESAFLLTKKDSFPMMELIAGACAGSFILLVLVAVAIYFKCRRGGKGNDSGANSLKLSETSSSGNSGHGDGSSTSSSASDRDRRRDSLTSPTYTVEVGDKGSPGVATINLQPPPPQMMNNNLINNNNNNNALNNNYIMSHALTLPTLPHLLPSYHRYADTLTDATGAGGVTVGVTNNGTGLVRLSSSVNDNFDDWLKQSRLATFSHLGAYQPSVSFRHPLPPIPPVVQLAPANTEQSRLATDV